MAMHEDLAHTLETGGAGTAVLLDEPDPQALVPASSGHSGTFHVRNPGTGEVVGTYPVATAVEVRAAVGRAREAAGWWSTLGFAERGRRLDAFRGILARRIHELAALMREEMGKPHSDAALEVAVVLDHIAWAAKHAEKTLSPRGTRSGLATIHLKGRVGYQPLGVIGVIGPWNFPVMTPLGSVIFALAAGNTVVFKPSEFSPGVGLWLERAMAEVVPEQPVLQVVTGTGATGAALSRAGVDKISFTGSTATAKKVMAACAESLTPLVAECGGKDAVIIDRDADLDAAVDGVTWSAFANAGQACIGTERVYVHQDRYEDFLARLVDRVGPLQAGPGDENQIGAVTMPTQVGVIEAHVRDALERGGRVLVGGAPTVGQVVQPVVLVDVPEDADAVQEETFGPTMTVRPVRDMDEAVALANGTRYGLGGAVYAKRRGLEIAGRIRSGMVSVNSVYSHAVVPSVPFGGVGDSGFGRIHGPEGLREFAFAQTVVRQRMKPVLALTTFGRDEQADTMLGKIVRLLHGRR